MTTFLIIHGYWRPAFLITQILSRLRVAILPFDVFMIRRHAKTHTSECISIKTFGEIISLKRYCLIIKRKDIDSPNF